MRVKYTVDLICLLAFVENLRAVTKQKLVRQYSKTEFLLMPLFTYTVKMQQQSLPKTYLRMFQQEASTTFGRGVAGAIKTAPDKS